MSSFARTDSAQLHTHTAHTYDFQQITNGREIIIIVNFSSTHRVHGINLMDEKWEYEMQRSEASG